MAIEKNVASRNSYYYYYYYSRVHTVHDRAKDSFMQRKKKRRKEDRNRSRIRAIATRSCVSFPRESLKFRKQGKGERDFVIDISRRNKASDSLESLHRARDRRRSDSAFPQLVRGMERGTDRKRNENVATQRTPSPSPGRPALERRKILKRLFLRGDWK